MRCLLFIVILALISTFAFAQMPTLPILVPEAQICWGAIAEDKWQPLVITSSIVDGVSVGNHKYNSKLGLQDFKAKYPVGNPTKTINFSFLINAIPNDLDSWYYYVRLRVKTDLVIGEWSEPSEWVSVHVVGKPDKPAKQ